MVNDVENPHAASQGVITPVEGDVVELEDARATGADDVTAGDAGRIMRQQGRPSAERGKLMHTSIKLSAHLGICPLIGGVTATPKRG